MRKIRIQKSPSDRLREAFERDLNPVQREAAMAPDGFNLILAGPGSGKTRVITYRVAFLIARGVPAESILLVTFTRRAAREMIGRLEGMIGPSASKVWAGTFHHIGNRILRRAANVLGLASNFTILDSEDQRDLIRLAMDDASITDSGRQGPKPAVIQHLISYAFNVGKDLVDVIQERAAHLGGWSAEIVAVAAAYDRRKRAANSLDYDDLLGLWARLLREFPAERTRQGEMFRHLLVDEMQDTNRVQAEIVETIARTGAGNLTAVGDDAQSIYRFRGADYDNILKFPERNPGTRIFRLETNYRSTPEIVAFTNASIRNNRTGFGKQLISARVAGQKPTVVPTADAYEEADLICQMILDHVEQGVPLSKMAVLYRNHHDSILLQGELVSRDIPYSVRSGQRFFEKAHIKDVLAHLRVIANPRDEASWLRLLRLLPGIGPAKASAIHAALAESSDSLGALRTKEMMAIVPTKSRGPFAAFVADLDRIRGTDPENRPASAIQAILQGGYPAIVRSSHERPEERLADIEQLAVLAARYESLDKLLADLMLAGDVYGMDHVADESTEILVLSTIHQAKGLEWSHVFLPRVIEDGFPSSRALTEPDGEEEERRIFYVAITRAMDELVLSYPLTQTRPGRSGTLITSPSRFLSEIDSEFYETAVVETDIDLAWTSGTNTKSRLD